MAAIATTDSQRQSWPAQSSRTGCLSRGLAQFADRVDDSIDDTVLDGLINAHPIIPVGILFNLLKCPTGFVRDDLIDPLFGLQDLFHLNFDVGCVADSANDPAWIAADLLSQAEHDTSSQSILIASDRAFADDVARAVESELRTMARAEIAGASWRNNGAIIVVPDLASCASIVDRVAAEHVELAMELAPAEVLSQKIRHAGAIFLGRHTPEAIGDYVAGTNHVLPTSRAARFSGGLGVSDFLKRTSFVSCTPDALAALGPAALALAGAEGLEAHGRSVSIRLNRRS